MANIALQEKMATEWLDKKLAEQKRKLQVSSTIMLLVYFLMLKLFNG